MNPPLSHRLHLALTVSLAVLLVILVIQGRNAAASRDQGLRTFICYFESAALKTPNQTPAQRRTIIRFFDGVTAKLHEPSCPN